MFTIKHIVEGEQEKLISAFSTEYNKQKNTLKLFGTPSGDIILSTGCAYVTNDTGSTVGAYNMRKNQEQKNG